MGEPTGVTLPAEYTVEIQDITSEVQAEKAAKEAKKLAKEKRKTDRKAIDWSKNLTTKQLQEIVKTIVEDLEND
jgi:CRISPR/Cas system CMR-associated protein Cmr1 (group 7 of RAMP superfamily)